MEQRRSQHVGAYVVVINDAKMLLIVKSRGPYEGSLDLPGGRIEFGEAPIQAASRELTEETGLSVAGDPLSLLDVWSKVVIWPRKSGDEAIFHMGVIFRAGKVAGALRAKGDGQDASGVLWVPIADRAGLRLSPFARWAMDWAARETGARD